MLKRSWAIAIAILASLSVDTARAEERCFAGAAAGSQFCIPIDYYSCIVGAERGQTCPNGCSGEERDGFYVSEEDKCAKQFGRPDGELCIDRHGFDPDPDCAANAPDARVRQTIARNSDLTKTSSASRSQGAPVPSRPRSEKLVACLLLALLLTTHSLPMRQPTEVAHWRLPPWSAMSPLILMRSRRAR